MGQIRKLLLVTLSAGTLFALGVTAANLLMIRKERSRITSKLEKIAPADVAVVLGTAPVHRKAKNPFFENRMDAAASLYLHGKVKKLLVSGDNSRATYNEPGAMRDALVSRGVPESAIVLDYAGFRTLDTMARAKKVFGVDRATIVTDDFHGARAVFLARHFGIDARCYTSKPVRMGKSIRTRTREIGARAAACLDVYMLRKQPKFYGTPERITVAQR